MNVRTFREVLRALLKRYKPKNWADGLTRFEVLMSIIVSQNSTDLVTERVMKELAAEVRVTPRAVAGMPRAKLARILRPAGLSRQKGPKIREVARTRVARRDDDMD